MRAAVIGAGVAGLTAAYRLGAAGSEVDVYERWPGLGGQAATLDVGDALLLERYYHHLFPSDRHILELYRELGLEGEIEWRASSVAIFADGRLWPFVGPRDLLGFRPLSPLSRVRLGVAALYLQRLPDTRFENVTAEAWVRRVMGTQVWERIWGPLLSAKFGDRAGDIAMAWLHSKITLRRRLGGEHTRRELLAYPRSSFQPLFEELARRIEENGGRVLIDRPAARLSVAPEGGMLVTAGAPGSFRAGHDPHRFVADGAPVHYDAVVVTVPSDIFAALLDTELTDRLDPGYLARVAATGYSTALCLLLELERPLTRFYWTNVADPAIPFIGLIEQTNFVDSERYRGRHFLYVANYLPAGHELLALDADALLEAYLPGIRAVNEDFSASWVCARWLSREPSAQPLATVGYRQTMPPLQTGMPGLVLANTTQIFPEDRGTNYAVRLGDQAAAAVLAQRPLPVGVR
jgi:protoporphyrinogen oxidase